VEAGVGEPERAPHPLRDGVVDTTDVDPDEDVGPLTAPPDPTDPADVRYLFTRIIPGGWPEGFANPIFFDTAGDGWQPPGLARGAR
jgi:hypothetical protein